MAIVVVTYTRESRQYCRDRRLHPLVFSQCISVVSKETRVNHPSVDSARDGERRNPSVSFKSDPCTIWMFFILYGCSVLGAGLSNGRAAVELDPIILCHALRLARLLRFYTEEPFQRRLQHRGEWATTHPESSAAPRVHRKAV